MLPNEFVADIVDAHPDRFHGVGAGPLDRPMAAVAAVRGC